MESEPTGIRKTGFTLVETRDSRGASSLQNSVNGILWILATSEGAGTGCKLLSAQNTKGDIIKPDRVTKSSKAPTRCDSESSTPTSSRASLIAASRGSSAPSSFPPGNAHCPPWFRRPSILRVRSKAHSRDQFEFSSIPSIFGPSPASKRMHATAALLNPFELAFSTSNSARFDVMFFRSVSLKFRSMESPKIMTLIILRKFTSHDNQ